MNTLLADRPVETGPLPGAPRCGNCRVPLTGPFCARCGQRDVDLNLPARALLREGVQEFVAIDRRVLRTLRLLFARPGHLTRVYLAGRRVRHTSPLRLYLLASVLFFSAYVMTLGVREAYNDARNPRMEELVRRLEAIEAESGARAPVNRSLADRLRDVRPTMEAGWRRSVLDRGTFITQYSRNLSRALFLALPVLSLILGLVYARSGRPLIQHLVFALHFGAAFLFGFLALMLTGVAAKVALAALGWSPAEAPDVNLALYLPGGVALFGYLFLSLRRVYRDRPLVRAARFALTAVLFALSLAFTFSAAVAYTTLMLG